MDAYTSTIVIDRSPEDVFDFVRTPENQTRWAVNFVQATRPLGDGRYVMDTPVGELTYRVEADPKRCVVDWVFMGDTGESVLPARVVGHGSGSLFTFTIVRMPGQPDEAWEAGKRGIDEELGLLKQLLEDG
jgi:uncharacterized protein YndB with AHSA1/START domain